MKNANLPSSGPVPETAALLAALGPQWARDINGHRDQVVAHYAALLAPLEAGGPAIDRDLAYGTAQRQVLDVHFDPRWQPGTRDVVVFLHGGAFVRGRKSVNGRVYDNVAHWFARQGIVGVNVEYRLAPQAPYPAGAQDVAQAFRWVQRHIARYGGRPDRIFLMGHSAGGCHVASAVFDPAVAAIAGAELAGAVLVSARLRADVLPDNPNADGVRAYFGADAALYEQRSPASHVQTSNVPLLVAVAQYENPHLDRYGEEFYQRALQPPRTALTRFVRLDLHNHTSIVAHFGSGEDSLGPEITRFMAQT
ncbi:alpha/beta hydrolase [Pseudorhodoferax sp.]|uniref:alpha/beta hydrolase n=1 Tax=Pseudorhodoferax sp. TaxID=1993553 RepID=UPI002DD6AF9C|nr:alpha/beta hydrolase [Pseudorhodoferax sp.]